MVKKRNSSMISTSPERHATNVELFLILLLHPGASHHREIERVKYGPVLISVKSANGLKLSIRKTKSIWQTSVPTLGAICPQTQTRLVQNQQGQRKLQRMNKEETASGMKNQAPPTKLKKNNSSTSEETSTAWKNSCERDPPSTSCDWTNAKCRG
jgi:hypothetical protein